MADAIRSQIASDLELWKPDSAVIDNGGCLIYNYKNTRGFNKGKNSSGADSADYMNATARDNYARSLQKKAGNARTDQLRQKQLAEREALLANPLIEDVNEIIRICKEKEYRAAKYYDSLKGKVQFHARRRGYNLDFHEIRKEIQKDRQKMANKPEYRKAQKGRTCMVVRSDIELAISPQLWGQEIPIPSWAPVLPSISEEDAASGTSSQTRRKYVKEKPLKEAIWAIRDEDPFAFGGMEPEPLYERLSNDLNVDPAYFLLKKTEKRVKKLCEEALGEPFADNDAPEGHEEEEEDGDIELVDDDNEDGSPNADSLADTMNEDAEDLPDAEEQPAEAEAEEDLPDAEGQPADVETANVEPAGQTSNLAVDPMTIVSSVRARQLTAQLYENDTTSQIEESIPVETPRPRSGRLRKAPVRYATSEMSGANLGGSRQKYNMLQN